MSTIVKDKLYSYEIEGEQRMGVLENILNKNNVAYAVLDNGDSIPYNRFCLIASEVGSNSATETKIGDENIHVPMEFDQNGVPKLKTEGQEINNQNKITHTSQNNNQQNHHQQDEGLKDVIDPATFLRNNPIIILLEKAKLTEDKISIEIPIKLIDKALYATISSSFEDSEDHILTFLSNKIDLEPIKALIVEELKKRYQEKV